MNVPPGSAPRSPLALLSVLAGLGLAAAAWMLPINLKSLPPALLAEAGRGTPSVIDLGRELVAAEKIGPAQLVLAAARTLEAPGAPALATAVDGLAAHQAELVAWGGWDPFLEPLFKLRSGEAGAAAAASTPVLTVLLPEKARATLRGYLENSRSLGVQALLQTRTLTGTGRFVPATLPGGQPLDAITLLTALLYQGEHLSPPLQRELRAAAEATSATGQLGELEPFFIDLLSLSQRLNWVQLAELLRRTDDAKTVGEYAHLARVAPDELALIYTAALFADSADTVATYLIRYGTAGVADLRLALTHGRGAVRQLLLRQVPVNREAGPVLGGAAELALLHPQLALVLKYLGYFLGAFLVFRGLDRWLFPPVDRATLMLPRAKSGVLALLFAGMLVLATEPFLLQAAPASEFKFRLVLPVLAATPELSSPATDQPSATMDTTTILSIGFFAALQIAMYLLCLAKIRDVARQPVPPLVKLRLMENEENLFDGGLYVGIGGTAAALVMQVLGLIEPNLLAAYSSNLFGITCVALVKIRHVRPYKRQLILESQAEATVTAR
jgi:hypothetical protein